MNFTKAVLATAMIGALGGMYGCSEGDEATISIDAPTTNTTTDDGVTGSVTISENCPAFAGAKDKDADGNDVCALPAQISENRTLTNDVTWLMEGRVTVGNGNGEMSAVQGTLENGNPVLDVTLTIQEGTLIKAATGTFANLLITRGSKIQAVGSATAPIIFSSDDADDEGSGEWGGLIVHGYGDHNQCAALPCNIDAEGESGFAAGVGTPDDNSGTLSYVVVTEGGFEFSVGNEINGISMVGVGSGTTMDHIQVHSNSDDGVEFYGGAVNVKYLVLTDNLDDSVDWDEGYQGNLQYVIVRQSVASTGNAIEADTQGNPLPLSKPTLSNATFIGDGDETELLVFKKGSGGFLHNSVATVAAGNTLNTDCVLVDGADAQANINTALVFNNVIADCVSGAGTGVFGEPTMDQTSVFAVEAALDANYASQATEASLGAPIDWTAVNAAFAESVADETYLDATDFVGAVNPDGSDVWFSGWILPGTL